MYRCQLFLILFILFFFRDSTKPGRPCIKLIPNSNHNTNSTNNTTTSTSSATTCNAPPTYRASFSEASKSQKIVLSTLSTPATSHRTIQIVQATTRPPQGCEKRNSLLNWSATGSLPLISSNSSSDSQEYRKIIEVKKAYIKFGYYFFKGRGVTFFHDI